jgi:hypothetical protein
MGARNILVKTGSRHLRLLVSVERSFVNGFLFLLGFSIRLVKRLVHFVRVLPRGKGKAPSARGKGKREKIPLTLSPLPFPPYPAVIESLDSEFFILEKTGERT